MLGTIATDRTKTLASLGHPTTSALTGGYRLGFVVAAAFAVAGLLVAAALLRPPRSAQSDRIAERQGAPSAELA